MISHLGKYVNVIDFEAFLVLVGVIHLGQLNKKG